MHKRIHKFLAESGVASRRASEQLVRDNRVRINGVLARIGEPVDPEKDIVTVDGKTIAPSFSKVYFMMYKPRGVETTMRAGSGKTLGNLWPKEFPRVFPVGRLDKDSEGLLILTNDGGLSFRLTHPKFAHEKEYEVMLTSTFRKGDLSALQRGVISDGERLSAESVEWVAPDFLKIVLTSGKNRHIRRMLESLGYEVEVLKRVRIGKLFLGRLRPGQIRQISGTKIFKDL